MLQRLILYKNIFCASNYKTQLPNAKVVVQLILLEFISLCCINYNLYLENIKFQVMK